jgi:hypothetical protein
MLTHSLAPKCVVAIGLACGLVLGGCASAETDSLTEPTPDTATENTTVEPEDETLSPEIFPFAEGIPFTTQIDCNTQIDRLVSEALGGAPAVIGLGDDELALITQQSGVAIGDGAEEIFALVSELVGVGVCPFESGTGQYGETQEGETLTGLPEGMSGLRWTTYFLDAASENCDEYVERRSLWFVQQDANIHLTTAAWFGCGVEGEFSNEVSWEDVYTQAQDAHQLLLDRL